MADPGSGWGQAPQHLREALDVPCERVTHSSGSSELGETVEAVARLLAEQLDRKLSRSTERSLRQLEVWAWEFSPPTMEARLAKRVETALREHLTRLAHRSCGRPEQKEATSWLEDACGCGHHLPEQEDEEAPLTAMGGFRDGCLDSLLPQHTASSSKDGTRRQSPSTTLTFSNLAVSFGSEAARQKRFLQRSCESLPDVLSCGEATMPGVESPESAEAEDSTHRMRGPDGRRAIAARTHSGLWVKKRASGCASNANLENTRAEQCAPEAKRSAPKSSAKQDLCQSIGRPSCEELLEDQEDPFELVRRKSSEKTPETTPGTFSHMSVDVEHALGVSPGIVSMSTAPSESSVDASEKALDRSRRCGCVRVSSPLLQRVWGVLPWRYSHGAPWCSASGLYQRVILILAAAAVATSAENFVTLQTADAAVTGWGIDMHARGQELADLVLAVGSFVGLLSARHMAEGNIVGHEGALLISYANGEDLTEGWSYTSSWQSGLLVLIWIFVTAARCMAPTDDPCGLSLAMELRGRVSVVVFAFTSGLLLVLSHSVLHVVGLLPMALDAFTSHLAKVPHLDSSVQDWSRLQALLRKASRAVEGVFVRVQSTVLVLVLVGVTEMGLGLRPEKHIWLFVVGLLLGAVSLWLFFRAAEVTAKCSQMPSLVNSMSFGLDVDVQRHFLVEHITYSAAGFYVNEVRLTAGMAIKMVYFSCIVAYALFTKVASGT